MLQLKQNARATLLAGLVLTALVALPARSQSQVTTRDDKTEQAQATSQITEAVRKQCESGQATVVQTIRKQLERSHCQLALPPAGAIKLTATEIEQRGRKAHLRVGWVYLCTKCDQWHNNLAGGYALTTNGAVATCYHVVNPPRDFRTGALIAADNAGRVFPIIEVLAANRYADACIVQVKGETFTPLPLNTNVSAGATVYCLGNPQGQVNEFSQGVVKRLLELPERTLDTVRGAPRFTPVRLQVSAAFGPGSSGSALLDACGNALGHASTITFAPGVTDDSQATSPSQSVFHEATSARDVLSLVHSAR